MKKYLALWKEMLVVIGAIVAINNYCWIKFYLPDMQKMLAPITYKVECMNYVITKYIPSAEMEQAVKEFDRIKIENSRKRGRK